MAIGYVTWTLGRYHGDYSAAAKSLGVSRATVYRFLPAGAAAPVRYRADASLIPSHFCHTPRLLRFFGQNVKSGEDPAMLLSLARHRYRELARHFHPDHGGSAGAMEQLNKVWTTLEKRLSR